MKTLYLVRHAKSSWKHTDLKDIERPLKKRGKKNADFMSKLLNKGKNVPDILISSPAVRAYNTAVIFAENFGIDEKDIIKNEKLYMADYDDFISVIEEIPGKINKTMLFSHNPGLTYFASTLGKTDIDNIPTCGIIRLDFDCEMWSEIKTDNCKLIFFEFPKKYS
ncbi:MAG: SixA phosphatase family protein [Ignavibacteria bacterium]